MVKPTNVWKLLWNVPKTAWVLPVCLAWLAGVSPQAIALEGEPEAPQVENSSAENTLAENTLETSSQEASNVTDVAALSPESSHEVDAQPSLAEREDAIARETLRERETVERVTDEIASDRLGELAENTPDYMQQVNSVSDPAVNLEQLENPMNDLGQVNSVNQLTDISPSDWAYQAVKSMVERYQCLEGYPDQTFRGNRPVTRFEFAAALNACLDRVLELVGTNPEEEIDLTTIQRLLEEFQAELSNLDGRIEDLEARAAQLEANQFSTTTKLSGLVTFNVTDVFGDDDIVAEGFGPFPGQAFRELDGEPLLRSGGSTNTTFSGLVWLTLNTSFSGKDNLTTLLAVSNGTSPINNLVSAGLFNTVGTPFFDQTSGVNTNEVIVRTLQYSFPVTDFLSLTIGPRINWYIFFDFNPYANIINGTGSFNGSGGAIFNNPNRGAGAVAQFDLGDKLSFNVGYLVENDEFLPSPRPAADPEEGLFGRTNNVTAELTFSPSSNANIRLLYQRSNINAINNFVPLKIAVLDNGLPSAFNNGGGGLNSGTTDAFQVNFDWTPFKHFGIYGRYYYLDADVTRLGGGEEDVEAQGFQFGLGFPDLGKEGAVATLSFYLPFDVIEGEEFVVSAGGDSNQFEIEGTYFFPINNNITIVPNFNIIGNLNNIGDNDTVVVGNIRTMFTF